MQSRVIEKLTPEQLQQAYGAYSKLMSIYEDACGGPNGCREFAEWHGFSSSRRAIRLRYEFLMFGGGDEQ